MFRNTIILSLFIVLGLLSTEVLAQNNQGTPEQDNVPGTGKVIIDPIPSSPPGSVGKREVNEDLKVVNYPNPFTLFTSISFTLDSEEVVSLAIFDSTGKLVEQLVDNEVHQKGTNIVRLQLDELASGTYYCILKINNKTETLKLLKK